MANEQIPTKSGVDVDVRDRSDGPIGDSSSLVRGTVAELERMLDAKHVIGEPMTFGDTTVIPLVSMGFGFGAGSGGGKDAQTGSSGGGGGGGGGGGIKPIAVLVVNGEGVTLSRIPDAPSGLDKLGGAVADALGKLGDRKNQSDD